MYRNYFCQKVSNPQNLILSRIYINNYICGSNISKNLQKCSTSVLYKSSSWLIKKNSNKFLLQSGPNTVGQQFKTTNAGKERKELVVTEQKEPASKLSIWKAIPASVISTQTIDNILRNISMIYDNLKKAVMIKQRYLRASLINYVLAMRNMNVGQCFDAVAKSRSNEVMIYFENTKWTYKQVEILSNKITNYFLSLNYEKGDVIAIFVTNRPEYVTLVLGLSKIGVICTLINTTFKGDALLHAIKLTDCKGLIVSEDLLPELNIIKNTIDPKTTIFQLDGLLATKNFINLADALIASPDRTPEIIHNINKSDPLIYIYTSVIANWPIAAMLPHSKFITNSVRVAHTLDLKKEDIVYDPLPLYYKTGILGTGPSLICGIPVVLRRKFSPLKYWSDCAKYKCTVGQCDGDLCNSLLELQTDNENKHNIKTIVGSQIDNNIKRKLTEKFHVSIAEFCDSADEYYVYMKNKIPLLLPLFTDAQAELSNLKPLENNNTPNLGKLLKMHNHMGIKRKTSISDIPETPKLLINPDVPTQTNANNNIKEKNVSKSLQYENKLNVDESKIFKKIVTSNTAAQNNPNISTEETNVSKQLQYENRLNFDEPEIYKRGIKSDVTQNRLDINIKANIPKLLCENDIHFDYSEISRNSIKSDVATQNNPNISVEETNVSKQLQYENRLNFDEPEIYKRGIKSDVATQNNPNISVEATNVSKQLQYENRLNFDEPEIYKRGIKSDVATQNNPNISVEETNVSKQLQFENRLNFDEPEIYKRDIKSDVTQNNPNISVEETNVSKQLQYENRPNFDEPEIYKRGIKSDVTQNNPNLNIEANANNIPKLLYQNDVHFDDPEMFRNCIKPDITTQNKTNNKTKENNFSKPLQYENKFDFDEKHGLKRTIKSDIATQKNTNISIEEKKVSEPLQYENKCDAKTRKVMATQTTEKRNNENRSMEVMISNELQKSESKLKHDELNIHKTMIKPSSTTQNNTNSITGSVSGEAKIPKIIAKKATEKQNNENISVEVMISKELEKFENKLKHDELHMIPKIMTMQATEKQNNENSVEVMISKEQEKFENKLKHDELHMIPKIMAMQATEEQNNENSVEVMISKEQEKFENKLKHDELNMIPKIMAMQATEKQNNENISIEVMISKELQKFENKLKHDELNMTHKIMIKPSSTTTQNNANSIEDSKISKYENKPNLDEPKIPKMMVKSDVANANISIQKVFKDLPKVLRNLTMEDTLTPKMIVKPDVARQNSANITTQKVFKDLPKALRNLTTEDTLTPKMIIKPDVARQKSANIRTQKVFKDLPKALRNLTMEDTLTPKMIVEPDAARQKNVNIRTQKVFKDLPKALRNLTTEDTLTPRSVDKDRLTENKEEETISTTEIESRINYLINRQECALYSVEIPGMNKNARMMIISDPGHAINLEKFSNEIKKLLPRSARPTFIRVVDDSSTVAETFKEKLQFYTNEGFDPTKIKDKLYYINTQTQLYEALTENTYKKIIAKEIII